MPPTSQHRGRPKTSLARWGFLILTALFTVAVASLAYGFCKAGFIIERTHSPTPTLSSTELEGGDRARGEHLVLNVVRCGECHAPDLAGKVVVDSGLGRMVAPNITPASGSVTANYSSLNWLTAVRHGVSLEGRGLWLMPVQRFRRIAPRDLRDMIAYLRTARPIERSVAPSELSLFGRTLLAFGRLPLIAAEVLLPNEPVPSAPAAAPTPAYGAYLVAIAGCDDCHGANMGGQPDGPLPAPALRGGESVRWTLAQWKDALRLGRLPDGGELDEDEMPIRAYRALTDLEVAAIRAFVVGAE